MTYLLPILAGLAFAVAVCVLAILRKGKLIAYFPPTLLVDQHDANATNYWSHIVIKRGIDRPGAVLCQERAEWGWKWKRGYLFARSAAKRRAMEFFGHAVEIEVAARCYGMDRNQLEHQEAYALLTYPQFAGWSVIQLREGIRAARPEALEWIAGHEGYIAKAVGLFGGAA